MVLINMVVQFSQISCVLFERARVLCLRLTHDITALETMITPVTLMWYGFGQLENSLMYSAITGCFFLCFAFIIVLSRRGVLDRVSGSRRLCGVRRVRFPSHLHFGDTGVHFDWSVFFWSCVQLVDCHYVQSRIRL